MPRQTRKEIAYHYRGGIERGTGSSYKWHEGYSEGTAETRIYYPWMTQRECRLDAREQGYGKAVFYRDGRREQ